MHNIICAILFLHKYAVNPLSAAEKSNHTQQEENRIPTYSMKSLGLIHISQKVHMAIIPLNFRVWDQNHM